MGVEKDLNKAIKYWEKAAAQGHAVAQNTLGKCYTEGVGGATDYKKAFEYYKKAADQDYADAQYNLGFCYIRGVKL